MGIKSGIYSLALIAILSGCAAAFYPAPEPETLAQIKFERKSGDDWRDYCTYKADFVRQSIRVRHGTLDVYEVLERLDASGNRLDPPQEKILMAAYSVGPLDAFSVNSFSNKMADDWFTSCMQNRQ